MADDRALNGCSICGTLILERDPRPDLSIEFTGRRALPNYREAWLLIGFEEHLGMKLIVSNSRLKIGLCKPCKESVDSYPPKFYHVLLDNARKGWVEEMNQLNKTIEEVVKYSKMMFSIRVYGYDGKT